jgi:nucleoside-diphosphate-sugar epimerase
LVNAALHKGAKRLIYISSVAALGRAVNGDATTEDTKWGDGQDATNYALSKFLAEQEVWRGQAEGLSVAALYPSIILGAWKWTSGTAKMFAFADKGSSFFPSGHTGVVDVRYVAKAVVLLINRNEDRDRFLLNGANISFEQLFGKIATTLGHQPPSKLFPERWARLITWLDTWRSWLTKSKPLLTKETTRASYKHHVYDSTKSKEILKLEYTPIDQTIEETAAIFKE